MDALFELEGMARVAASAFFVLLTAGISRWGQADVEKDLFIATLRSFVQLIAIGFVLELIFEQDNPVTTIMILIVMTSIAGYTTAQRAKQTPHALLIALTSIGGGSAITIGLLVALQVFDFTPQNVIPIGGMVIGNAMTTATLVMMRLTNDFSDQRLMIESMLALGADSRQATLPQFRRSLQNALVPIIDTTKTVGIIKLPGAMTGMILAGASPLEAVQLQIIVMYMLVGASAFTSLGAAFLTYRQFFTPAQQLRSVG